MENEEIEKKETNVVKVETMQENPDNTDSNEGFAPSENKFVVKGLVNWFARGLKAIQGKLLAFKEWWCGDPDYKKKLEAARRIVNEIYTINKKIEKLEKSIKKTKEHRLKNSNKRQEIEAEIEKWEKYKRDLHLKFQEEKEQIEKKIGQCEKTTEDLSKKINALGFVSKLKSIFSRGKSEEKKIQEQIRQSDNIRKHLESELENKRNEEIIQKTQLDEKITTLKKILKQNDTKNEQYNTNIDKLKTDQSALNNEKDTKLKKALEGNDIILKDYLKKTSLKAKFIEWAKGFLLGLPVGIFCSSIFVFNIAFKAFNVMIGQPDDINGGDIVAVISDGEYKDILLAGHEFAVNNNLPILLSGTGNDVEEMKKMLVKLSFSSDIIEPSSAASNLVDNVWKSYANMIRFKTPIIFTDPVKIPRMRCEFNKRGMKNARFYDIQQRKTSIKDTYTYSPRPISVLIKGAFNFFIDKECWFPGGSGRK